MLGLKIRKDFRGDRLKRTAVDLKEVTIAMTASEFLDITYPSVDALKALGSLGSKDRKPLILMGERGQGKSHLLAMLYYAFKDAEATSQWMKEWASRLGKSELLNWTRPDDMCVIREALHSQEYKFLWDIVFEQHLHGTEALGMWKGLGDKKTNVPSKKILLEIFRRKPTVLIFDEFHTWYEGLVDESQHRHRTWAFNFIQLLSEIAKDHPDLLVLVVSVLNGETDAFRQIRRVEHTLIDFKGPEAKEDRQKLLLHRLFENRMQIPREEIKALIEVHVCESLRLLKTPDSEHDEVWRKFIACWPYSPYLLDLLEDQVLVTTSAQEKRDLIRILVDLFKRHEDSSITTAADFRLDDEESGVIALIDSVNSSHHEKLREKALRNLEAVQKSEQGLQGSVPHLAGIIGALWLRSLTEGNIAGAEPVTLQVDVTRGEAIDDNKFRVELKTIVENSFNIHEKEGRLALREEENPQAKLMASARNDKNFDDGSDRERLAKVLRYLLGGGEATSQSFRVLVLSDDWVERPWSNVEEHDMPSRWDERLPLLVLPESPESLGSALGNWLKRHLEARRNTVRFLLPQADDDNIFTDRELLIRARAMVLAERWHGEHRDYRRLLDLYRRELEQLLSKRFDRFAILDTWDFREASLCTFRCESHGAEGGAIPEAIEEHIRRQLFIPEDCERLVKTAAANSDSLSKLLRELREPRPAGEHCVPWLGEERMKEFVFRLCARGEIAIDMRGLELLQKQKGEDEAVALQRMRKGGLPTGRHLEETLLLLPQAESHTEGIPRSASLPLDFGGGAEGGGGVAAGGAAAEGARSAGGEGTGESVTPPPLRAESVFTPYACDVLSPLSLLGRVESWGIEGDTRVEDLSLRVASLSGAELDSLLSALPEGILYALQLRKEEKG